MAKKLKKEKVSVDVVSFGEVDENAELLKKFVETVNGRDGTGSHLVTIPPGPHLSDALISSAIIQVSTFSFFKLALFRSWVNQSGEILV